MKKLLLLIPLLAAFIFCGCKKNDDQVPVELAFSAKEASMQVGSAPLQLSVVTPETYVGNPDMIWSSSNASIASVSATGAVTAVGPGVALITGYVKGLNAVRGECTITVRGKIDTQLASEFASYEINAGETAKVKYAYTPLIKTSWQFNVVQSDSVGEKYLELLTDNNDAKEFGSVDFIGLKPGVVNVTLVNKVDRTVKTTFQVTIKDVAVQSFDLDKTAYEVGLGSTIEVVAKILPEEAAYRALYFKSSNPSVFTVDEDGVITPVALGSAVIYVTTQDGQKVSAPVTVKTGETSFITFAKKTAEFSLLYSSDMVGAINVSTSPVGGAPIIVTVDNTYAPETGLKSDVEAVSLKADGTQWGVKAIFGRSSYGTARLIANNGTKDESGKLIADTCIVTIDGMDNRILLTKSQYYGIELGAKTLITASASRFEFKQGVAVTLQEATLFLPKGAFYYDAEKNINEELKVDKVIEKLTPNVAVSAVSTQTINFATLASASHWKSCLVRYVFKTSDGVHEAYYTIDQQVVEGNGSPFAAPLP